MVERSSQGRARSDSGTSKPNGVRKRPAVTMNHGAPLSRTGRPGAPSAPSRRADGAYAHGVYG